MRILLTTPAPAHSRKGNRITALRWARLLKDLGHHVIIAQEYQNQRCDLLVALHARRSFPSIERFHHRHPNKALVLALTGTDLYGDIHTDTQARQALDMAWRFILLQPDGIAQLPPYLHPKARVIFQSVRPPSGIFPPRQDVFDVCVIGHLRPVKDPFRTARAARLLPASSRLRVLHMGAALSPDMEEQAGAEQNTNPRYTWLGELPRWKTLRQLCRCRLLVLTSQMEGGANVVSEALACCVPVLSSHISGSIGMLGPDYPGYFPTGNTRALTALLKRSETEPSFYNTLATRCSQLSTLVDPAQERQGWSELLAEWPT